MTQTSVIPSGESRSSGTEIRFKVCPACAHGKWAVSMNPDTGAWYCYKCEARGVDPSRADPRRIFLPKKEAPVWHEIALPGMEPLDYEARAYLEKRGLTDPENYGIIKVEGEPRILFPYMGRHGTVIYWSTRSYAPDGKPKYITAPGRHPLYVLPTWGPHPEAIVVEGIMDAIMLHRATGLPVIALGGKALPRYLEHDLSCVAPTNKLLMLDYDALHYAMKLKIRLSHCSVLPLPLDTDPADLFRGDHAKDGTYRVLIGDWLRRCQGTGGSTQVEGRPHD